MKSKTLILCLFISAIFSLQLFAQSGTQLGKVVYLEGTAQVIIGTTTTAIKVNTVVYNNQTIKTAAKSVVEIQWSNGSKTSVEPLSSYSVQALFDQSGGQALAQSENVFAGFKKIFKEATDSKRAEVGGIRRSKAKADTINNPEQTYWKEDKEISFEEASVFYEKGDYVKSVWAFKTFLDQKPLDGMSKYAMFALGHSYLKINNQQKAKDIFEQFIAKYNGDDLRTQAETVLAKFVASN